MQQAKKVWEKPQMIILTRNTPEESVLTHCKVIGIGLGYPDSANQDGCNNTATTNCGNCQSRSGS